MFATSWAAPVEDQEPIVAGIFGKATLLDHRFRIGGVSLIDALNQTVGDTYGAQCPKNSAEPNTPDAACRWRRIPSPER